MDPEDLILDDAKRHLVERYIDLFVNWNQRINLSAARTRSAVASHVEDSLHVVPYLRFAGRIIDVGAGGGLPGVLVAICLPGAQVVSLEPVNKKHAFLRTAARELGLGNYEPRCERVEDHAQRDYDAAVSRATWDLRQWLEMGDFACSEWRRRGWDGGDRSGRAHIQRGALSLFGGGSRSGDRDPLGVTPGGH
jgi:16S rRNA (guanine527-N7)-methyltransferase